MSAQPNHPAGNPTPSPIEIIAMRACAAAEVANMTADRVEGALNTIRLEMARQRDATNALTAEVKLLREDLGHHPKTLDDEGTGALRVLHRISRPDMTRSMFPRVQAFWAHGGGKQASWVVALASALALALEMMR